LPARIRHDERLATFLDFPWPVLRFDNRERKPPAPLQPVAKIVPRSLAVITAAPNNLAREGRPHRRIRYRFNQSTRGWIMLRYLTDFLSDQSGATAIEYGLIAAGIAVAIIATVEGLGTNLNTTFSSVSTALK
jgi:pilus assembly protein Flp/PilA